jgi:hypothetical protein
MEGRLSFSIYLAGVVLILSLLGCLPDVLSLILGWLLPERLALKLGVISGPEPISLLATLCETLMAVSGAYLVLALLVRSHTRHGPQ